MVDGSEQDREYYDENDDDFIGSGSVKQEIIG